MNIIVHTDGGARGNPGPAAIGVYIQTEEQGNVTKLIGFGKEIGETTNNVAEYSAVIEALTWLISHKPENVEKTTFFLDSLLVVSQLNGVFKIKEPHLRDLSFSVRALEAEYGGGVSYVAVRREQNREADMLVNKALDHDTF
jgi:ribonuclease HI